MGTVREAEGISSCRRVGNRGRGMWRDCLGLLPRHCRWRDSADGRLNTVTISLRLSGRRPRERDARRASGRASPSRSSASSPSTSSSCPRTTHSSSAAPQDIVALFVFLIVAGVTSSLVSRLQEREREARRRAIESETLYRLSTALIADLTLDTVLATVAEQVTHIFHLQSAAILLPDDAGTLQPRADLPRRGRCALHRRPGASRRGDPCLHVRHRGGHGQPTPRLSPARPGQRADALAAGAGGGCSMSPCARRAGRSACWGSPRYARPISPPTNAGC